MLRPPPLLLAAVVSLLALLGLGASAIPATAAPTAVPLADDESDYVIIAGAAGLRWDDIDVERTPTLWTLAERGAIGSLSTRSAHVPTCPGDGWLTLGAGNYAERTRSEVAEVCPRLDVAIERPDAIGASLPDQHTVAERQRELSFGTVPGALAESVRCTTAIGPGAAVAAARSFGRVDRYAPELPADPTSTLSKCVLSIIDLGAVDGLTPQRRAKQVEAADALLAKILAARPERSTLLVAGVSDTDRTSRLHVVIADGKGWSGGWLTSASTGRPGYLELVDLAPTALSLLGREVPKKVMAGHPAAHALGRPDDLGEATAAGTDADRQAAAARTVSAWFFLLLAAAQIGLFAAVVPLLRRSYRHAGPTGPTPPPERLVRLLELLLVGAALAVPAAMITGIVPWWRFGQRGLIFFAITGAVLAVLTLITVRLPVSRTRTLGPVGAVAAIATAVVGLDLITGARLQLNGVAGYSALEGGRYSGIGMVGMGVFFAAVLLSAACLAQLVPQRRRPLVVAGVGVVPILLVGTPAWGADAGGAIALTAGVCLTAALCPGGWLSFRRLAVALGIGLVVTVGFAYVDLHRPVEQQGSLGRFLAQWAEGTSGLTLNRLGSGNRIALVTSPLTVLALVAAVFMWAVLMRPWGGLKRLYGIYPPIRAAVVGIAVSSVLGGLLGGAALNVAGTAAATALPLLTLGAMRVLGHAADRTRIVEESVSTDTPVGVSGT